MSQSHKIDKRIKYLIDDPIFIIHEHGLDVDANHIYLMGNEDYIHAMESGEAEEPGIEYTMTNKFIKNLNIIMRRSSEPIVIHMKTCGGDWAEGMAIYDAIKACPNPVTILNYTHATSMSSLIFLAANKRVMMKHSQFMFHRGTEVLSGEVKQVLTEMHEVKKALEAMYQIYIEVLKEGPKFNKRSREYIRKWLTDKMDEKQDVYFTAKEAKSYGFTDEVFGEDGYDWSKLTVYTDQQLERG